MREVGGGRRTGGEACDPDYAPNCEVFEHLSYDEIYHGVAQLKPDVLTLGRQTWQSAAIGVAEAVRQAHAEIRGAIADGWRGPAAESAAGAVQSFEELGQHLSDVMGVVGQRLGQANDAAEALRAALSQPVVNQPDLEAALLDPKRATANVALQKAAESLRLDAVRVMNSIYAETFLPTGSGVPAFREDGMYPQPVMVEGPPDPTAPGGGSADAMGPGSGARVEARHGELSETAAYSGAAEPAVTEPENAWAGDHGSMSATAPAAAIAPAAPAPAAAPAAASAAVVPPATASETVFSTNGVASQPVSATSPIAPVPAGASVVAAPMTRLASAESENQRKRAERDDRRDASTDAIGGMGAGVVGGLAGGALAASGDALRPNSAPPVRSKPARLADEDDEEYYSDFDEPTFLEPAEPGGELVGRLDPTTPPVLGEWAEE
ncbi:hypothetical protein NDR87_17900 [Nocardia sp. CDC159]|uniref:PPE domain-containing protein n=1 Tax=Nocardia pulmonis TaxID=2951408 RepID=A0A9X2EAH3_9NOCA|nr:MULTISPECIES: hypothetical protein [Nocardia]MCM6775788.1 hypothetical protein [Nocardia pulmonis]MCM6788236.1 hypothetical protein [Nocardia sp. CDC159]